MARETELLTAREVTTKKKPGLYHDGLGLYLQVTGNGGKSWLFRYGSGTATSAAGKSYIRVREMGLGPTHTISLAEARDKAKDARQKLLDGKDPIEEKRERKMRERLADARSKRFRDCVDAYIAAHRSGWRNEKHASQWGNTLETYCYPEFGDLPASRIDTDLILRVLEPIWSEKNPTAIRLRGRIELVLDWATVRGYREGLNPARWKGHLDKLLPKPSKVSKQKHHAALSIDALPAFVKDVRRQEGVAARALEFIILTCTRTGEAIGAKWSEFDLRNRVWTVPAERTKAGKEHRVPLTARAIEILEGIKQLREEADFVFPGREGEGLSNMACLKLLERMERDDITVHGFRSTFRDWAGERTNFARDVIEKCLAHTIAGKVEAAYQRGDLFEKRRRVMEAWNQFCEKPAGEKAAVHNIEERRGAKHL